jgi:hypothetical protein
MDISHPAGANASGAFSALCPHPDTLPTNAAAGVQNNPVNTNSLGPLRNSVNAITNANVKNALLTIIDAASEDAVKARGGIEERFNSSMDPFPVGIQDEFKKLCLLWAL